MVCFEFGVKDFMGHDAGLGRGLLSAIAATATTYGAGGVVESFGLIGFAVRAGGEMHRPFRSSFERNGFGFRRDHPQSWCSVGSDHPQSWCSVGSGGCYLTVGQDRGELAEDVDFTVSQRGKRGITGWVCETVEDVMSASDDKINGRGQRHIDLGGKPGEGIKNALRAGVPHPNGVALVRVKSWAGVPAVRGMC
jgi:hypothetical protein